jgi:hypothetical protein
LTTGSDAERPERSHHYSSPAADSGRWDAYRPRQGDIVVCTPPKCGTTWTQMICALLVHQSPDLPLPLTRLSRWLDRHSEPIEQVIGDFEAQPFRRIIKTHTPLDGIPFFDEVSYVVCARDPRDASLSMIDHFANLSEASMKEARERAGLPADFKLPDQPNEFFRMTLSVGDQPWTWDGFPVGSVLYFLDSYLRFRALPNIFFLHYADLRADCEQEMRRLAAFLGIAVNEATWPRLVEGASFEAMKSHAGETAPGAHLGEWTKDSDFFRKARMGEWRDVLSPESRAFFDSIMEIRFSPKARAWIESGRGVAGDPKTF